MRASDADRERVAARLGRAYAGGSLSTDTFGLRIDGAYRARSRDQLRALTGDLPRRLGDAARDGLATVLARVWSERPADLPTVAVALPPDGPGPWTIGRSRSCRLLVDHHTVSRRHAELQRTPHGWEVHDLASTNGTRVNGWRVDRATLHAGDELVLGGVRVRLER